MSTIYLINDCCSCEGLTNPCCSEVNVDCCMYPAAAVESGQITFEDLPDSLEFFPDIGGSEIITKKEAPEFLVLGLDATAYYDFSDGALAIATGSGLWGFQIDFNVKQENQCLISSYDSGVVLDNFEDTYTLTGGGGSAVVTRESLCSWCGELEDNNVPIQEGGVVVFYSGGQATACELELAAFPILLPDKWYVFRAGDQLFLKDDPQNSPIGTYTGVISGTFTVS